MECRDRVFTAYSCLHSTLMVRVWCLDHLHSCNSATDPWTRAWPIRGQGWWDWPMRGRVNVSLLGKLSVWLQTVSSGSYLRYLTPISATLQSGHLSSELWAVWPGFIVGQKIDSIPVCLISKILTVESWSISRVQHLRRDPQRSSELCWAKN